jgi:hypothetical protein
MTDHQLALLAISFGALLILGWLLFKISRLEDQILQGALELQKSREETRCQLEEETSRIMQWVELQARDLNLVERTLQNQVKRQQVALDALQEELHRTLHEQWDRLDQIEHRAQSKQVEI